MQSIDIPTVMVADFYKDTRELLRYWLEMKGCRVVEATDGHQAVEITIGTCPDLILMSMQLPFLGGLETMRRIRDRSNFSGFPIVAMSTYPTAEARATALAAGCDSFIPQPIDFDVLNGVLCSLLPSLTCEPSAVTERAPISDMFSMRRRQTAVA